LVPGWGTRGSWMVPWSGRCRLGSGREGICGTSSILSTATNGCGRGRMFGNSVELNKGRGLCPMFGLSTEVGWVRTNLFLKNYEDLY